MHINYESIKTKAEKKVCAKHKEAAKLVVTATGIGFKEDCCCLEFEDEIMNFVADLIQKEVEKHIL